MVTLALYDFLVYFDSQKKVHFEWIKKSVFVKSELGAWSDEQEIWKKEFHSIVQDSFTITAAA